MIPKKDLFHGLWYVGESRSTKIAMWNGGKKVFVFLREKFGQVFLEELPHEEDFDGKYDAFKPLKRLSELIDVYLNSSY